MKAIWSALDTKGKTGAVLLVLLIFAALPAPYWIPYEPGSYVGLPLADPSVQHWLGTNDVGQDIFSRLLYGAQNSMVIAFSSGLLATTVAALIGITAGLSGGLWDRLAMRVVDVLLIIPAIIVLILIAAHINPGQLTLIVMLALLGWQYGARIIRGQTLQIKETGHIKAARSFGATSSYILRRHILPETGPILVIQFVQAVRRAVFMEAGLSFIGVTSPHLVSWGAMLQNGMRFIHLDVWQWWLIPPGLLLSLTMLALYLTGQALEETFDPSLRRIGNACY